MGSNARVGSSPTLSTQYKAPTNVGAFFLWVLLNIYARARTFLFPTDNSPSTQLKYDIIASKFTAALHNHNRRNAPSNPMVSFGLVGAVLEGVVAVVVIGFIGLRWVWKKTYTVVVRGLVCDEGHHII